MADDNSTKPITDDILNLVGSCMAILEAGELPKDDPSLPMVFGFATSLEAKLSELTGVESIEDERAREETFTVPRILGTRRADQDPWTDRAHSAAQKHEKHLTKALDTVSEAKGLAVTLRYALLSDIYDTIFAPEIMQLIIDRLERAQNQIDRHSIEHATLFIAYFDRDRPES